MCRVKPADLRKELWVKENWTKFVQTRAMNLRAKKRFSVKLTYWHGFGRAERVRMALALAGIEFEDIGMSTPEEWTELQATGKLKYGSVPLLEIDGKNLVQSNAVVRYVARRGNIYGDSDEERYEIDNICEALSDFYDPAMGLIFGDQGEELKEKLEKFLSGPVVKFIANKFEPQIANNSSGWLVGSRPSVADGFLFAVLRYISSEPLLGMEWMAQYPATQNLYEQFAALPQVANQLVVEKKLPFPEYVTNVRNTLQWFS